MYIRNLSEFSAALRGGQYSRVVYCGHALSGVNVLLPDVGSNIAPFHIAGLLKGSSVKHFDILGCGGGSIAGELATLVSKDNWIGICGASDRTTLRSSRLPWWSRSAPRSAGSSPLRRSSAVIMVHERFVVAVVVSIVATLSCYQGVGPGIGPNVRASSDYCRMAVAILDAVAKAADEQPLDSRERASRTERSRERISMLMLDSTTKSTMPLLRHRTVPRASS